MTSSMKCLLVAAMVLVTCSCGGSLIGGGSPDVPKTTKNMEQILFQMNNVMIDDAKKKTLRLKLKDSSGASAIGEGVKEGVFDEEILEWVVIPGTSDGRADTPTVKSTGALTKTNCSFCFPKMSSLLMVMSSKGEKRTVVLCPNSNHWKAFGESVPVIFSDSDSVQMIKLADLASYGITQSDWDNPAGMFGKKAPFDNVYE